MTMTLRKKWEDTRKDFADQVKEDVAIDAVKILIASAKKVDEWLDKLDKAKANGNEKDFSKAQQQAGEAVASYKGILDRQEKVVTANAAKLKSKKWKLALTMLRNGLKLITKDAAELLPPAPLPEVREKSSITSAEMQKPPFDAKWWLSKKSAKADRDNALAKALAVYQVTKGKIGEKPSPGTTAALVQALTAVKSAAEKCRADQTLSPVFQKETLAAIGSYGKLSDAAISRLNKVEGADDLKKDSKQLITSSPAFEALCRKEFSTESLEFLRLMYQNRAMNLEVYSTFIAPNGRSFINLPADQQKGFKLMYTQFQLTGNAAEWDNAKLLDETIYGIETLLSSDTMLRFRPWVRAALLDACNLP